MTSLITNFKITKKYKVYFSKHKPRGNLVLFSVKAPLQGVDINPFITVPFYQNANLKNRKHQSKIYDNNKPAGCSIL